ncbi:MAG: winged helix-turn-helix transcriptional regulator [archaeon]
MKKTEQVFREILYQALEHKKRIMTQAELSKELGFSLSTISLAVKKLERMNAISIGRMSFKVIDPKKILYLWASERNLEKDIIYKARADMPVREIEKSMPGITYAAYSAYKLKFKEAAADYSEVYVYCGENDLPDIKKRFPESNGPPNIFVLKKDENMSRYSATGTLAQVFVDLWNLRQWYASDFLKALEAKMELMV